MNNLISRRLIIRSKSVNTDVLSYVPVTEHDYHRFIAYEPSNTLKRVKVLIDKHKKQFTTDFEKLIAF